MGTPFKVVADEADCPSPDILSIGAARDTVFVAAFGRSVFRKSRGGVWSQADDGLPDGVVVNRLQSVDGSVYACTNQGLFYYDDNRWYATDIAIPCYQVMKQGAFFAAATEYGLWCKIGTRWENTAYPNLAIYDLFFTPDYYILATKLGISLYDRYTASGAEFPLGTAVTGLASYRRSLIGVTVGGELVRGDQRGGFAKTGFEGLTLYALKPAGGEVYVCSSRGLYRLEMMGSRLILRSLLIGYPVTDLSSAGDSMLIGTLQGGLKKVVLHD